MDTTRSQIASIVKVKVANFKCTGLMLRTIYYHRCDYYQSTWLLREENSYSHVFNLHHTKLVQRISLSVSTNPILIVWETSSAVYGSL